jgi:hypothetical protein
MPPARQQCIRLAGVPKGSPTSGSKKTRSWLARTHTCRLKQQSERIKMVPLSGARFGTISFIEEVVLSKPATPSRTASTKCFSSKYKNTLASSRGHFASFIVGGRWMIMFWPPRSSSSQRCCIRRSILLTMSLHVNYFVTCYSYYAENYTYIVSSDRDIASFQLIVWHVC